MYFDYTTASHNDRPSGSVLVHILLYYSSIIGLNPLFDLNGVGGGGGCKIYF